MGRGSEGVAHVQLDALVVLEYGDLDGLELPDADDIHVLAAAIKGQADELVTANLKDFPTSILGAYGIIRRDPDGFLLEMAVAHPDVVLPLAQTVARKAAAMDGRSTELRKFLRKSRLPRLGKYLATLAAS